MWLHYQLKLFSPTLDQGEEEKYLKRFAEGTRGQEDSNRKKSPPSSPYCKKYNTSGKDMDDLISIGTIGLIKAISTYDSNKGTRLATYASRCIDNEILMTIRSNKKINLEYSLQEPIGRDKEGNEINLLDILGTDGEEVLNEVDLRLQTKKLYKAISRCLKDREKVIIELRYGLIDGECKTQREIAGL